MPAEKWVCALTFDAVRCDLSHDAFDRQVPLHQACAADHTISWRGEGPTHTPNMRLRRSAPCWTCVEATDVGVTACRARARGGGRRPPGAERHERRNRGAEATGARHIRARVRAGGARGLHDQCERAPGICGSPFGSPPCTARKGTALATKASGKQRRKAAPLPATGCRPGRPRP